jgi:lysophospholipase L1-like esterase
MSRALCRTAAAGVVLSLAACGGAQPPTPSTDHADEPHPSASASPTEGHRYRQYVALGDSYTAAPFVTTASAKNPCVRSAANYPHLLARALGVRLADRSCTGADIPDLTGGQLLRTGRAAPQVEAVTARTDLVTVSIGGNPAAAQAWFDICPTLRDEDPHGSPCRDHFREVSGGGTDAVTRIVRDERRQLAALLTELRRRAPRARVLVVGYPAIFPEKGRCPEDLTLADGDVAYARATLHRLNALLRRSAAEAGAEYVDVYAATRGHDICSAAPWIQGRDDQLGVALAYHPRADEQRAVADLLLERLKRHR